MLNNTLSSLPVPAGALRVAGLALTIALLAPVVFAQDAVSTTPDAPALVSPNVEQAMACAPYLKEGILATSAFVSYTYNDARGVRRAGNDPICRMFGGPLRASEVPGILQIIARKHPDRSDVVLQRWPVQN